MFLHQILYPSLYFYPTLLFSLQACHLSMVTFANDWSPSLAYCCLSCWDVRNLAWTSLPSFRLGHHHWSSGVLGECQLRREIQYTHSKIWPLPIYHSILHIYIYIYIQMHTIKMSSYSPFASLQSVSAIIVVAPFQDHIPKTTKGLGWQTRCMP